MQGAVYGTPKIDSGGATRVGSAEADFCPLWLHSAPRVLLGVSYLDWEQPGGGMETKAV